MFYSLFCSKTSKSIYTPLRCTRYYQHSPVMSKLTLVLAPRHAPDVVVVVCRHRVSSSCVVIVLCLRLPLASPSKKQSSTAIDVLTAQFLVVVIVVVVLHSSLLFFFLKRSDRIAGDWSCIFDPLSCRRGRHSLLATRHRSNRTKGRCNFCWIILELLLTMTTTTSDNPKLARFRQSGMVTRGQRQCLVVIEVMMLPRYLLAV